MGRTTTPVGPRRGEWSLPPPFAAFRVVVAQAGAPNHALGLATLVVPRTWRHCGAMLCSICNRRYDEPGSRYCLQCRKAVHTKGAAPPPVTDPENVQAPRVEALPANTHLEPKPEDFGVTWEEVGSRSNSAEDQSDLFGPIGCWIGAALGIVVLLVNVFAESVELSGGLLVFGLMFGLPVGIVALVILHAHLEVRFAKQESPVEKFLAAKQAFEREQAEKELKRRRRQASYWQGLSGAEFERELRDLFAKVGYKAELTRSTGDAGVDIWLERDDRTTIVQCKRHEQPIGVEVARELYGVLMHEGADEAMIASVSGFTQGVEDFVQGKNIELLDLEDILKMQDQYGSP